MSQPSWPSRPKSSQHPTPQAFWCLSQVVPESPLTCMQVEQQGQAHLARFVRVPNADLPCLNVASSTRIKGSSGGRPVLQKGPRAPSTPAKKATRAVPTSSTSSGSVEEALRHCHCCFSTGKPRHCFHTLLSAFNLRLVMLRKHCHRHQALAGNVE